MKFSEIASSMLAAAACAVAVPCANDLRNIIYFDQYHYQGLVVPAEHAASITHVVMSFANSSLFTGPINETYTPFLPVADVRAMFPDTTKVGVALGGWADTAGFSAGSATPVTRVEYAAKIAAMVSKYGFDFVDIDWEYPGGNGEDYKRIPNSDKVAEIAAYPELLKAIKLAIAPLPLSIAVPGKAGDMIAFTPEHAPAIWAAVDWVNVMTYDLINRRDNVTGHHTDVAGSLASVNRYLALGLPAEKLNLGFAFYAKFFQTQPDLDCSDEAVGCDLVLAELADGTDAGTSGAVTFETINVSPPAPPTNLTASTDGSCGMGTFFTCLGTNYKCCSQYGFCGSSGGHCGAGCQPGYGDCTGPAISDSFVAAMNQSETDEENGGEWWWDEKNELFWTFETVDLIWRKFDEIVAEKGLGGVFAWSLGEDTYDWSHLAAINEGVAEMNACHEEEDEDPEEEDEDSLVG